MGNNLALSQTMPLDDQTITGGADIGGQGRHDRKKEDGKEKTGEKEGVRRGGGTIIALLM